MSFFSKKKKEKKTSFGEGHLQLKIHSFLDTLKVFIVIKFAKLLKIFFFKKKFYVL